MFGSGYTYIPARPGEARITLCDTSVAKKSIGYEPKVNLKNYIKEVTSE
jgi:nucleoside-diphosphate-sugar epimerase